MTIVEHLLLDLVVRRVLLQECQGRQDFLLERLVLAYRLIQLSSWQVNNHTGNLRSVLISNQFLNILENNVTNQSLLVILSGLLELRRIKQTIDLAIVNHSWSSSLLLLLLLLKNGISLNHRCWLLLHLHHGLGCWHSTIISIGITILVAILHRTCATILTLVVVFSEVTIVLVLPALVILITIDLTLILILILSLHLIHVRSSTVVVVHLVTIISVS